MFKYILPLLISVPASATIKVAVIDTGYDFKATWPDIQTQGLVKPKLCKYGHKDFAQPKKMTLETVKVDGKVTREQVDNPEYLVDNHGHGTHIAGLIALNAQDLDYCLVIIKFYDPINPSDNLDNVIKSFRHAINLGVDIINFSGGGESCDEEEKKTVIKALNRGITVVSAAGNERNNIDKKAYYPAMYDSRVVSVENWEYLLDKESNKLSLYVASSSNYSKIGSTHGGELGVEVNSLLPNNKYGKLTGTSQATAIRSGKLIKYITNVKKLNKNNMLERIKRRQNVA